MKKLLILLSIIISVFLLLISCSDKNSNEACLHETSVNLDKGNYDAVLASSCADSMQIGAAYFGKAGYDITNVLNRFVDANSSSSSDSDLNIYMTALTGDVNASTFTYLDNARTAYDTVPVASDRRKDADFYISLVDAMKSLSLIKSAIPNAVNPDGTLNTTCDKNNNSVPDQADATACALIASDIISAGVTSFTCNGAIYSRSTPTDITITDGLGQTVNGIYSGLTITITGSGASCGNDTYYRLLYQDPSDNTKYWVATTTTDSCTGSDGKTYYCPLPGPNIDFVSTINISIDNSVNSLATSITGTTGTDVQQSIQDIKAQACCGCITTPCTVCSKTCTSSDIADYITNNLK